jgi:hypothetical protein
MTNLLLYCTLVHRLSTVCCLFMDHSWERYRHVPSPIPPSAVSSPKPGPSVAVVGAIEGNDIGDDSANSEIDGLSIRCPNPQPQP